MYICGWISSDRLRIHSLPDTRKLNVTNRGKYILTIDFDFNYFEIR